MTRAFPMAVGAGLLGIAVIVGAGDIFLWDWARASQGHSDISARGPFLLGAFLPIFLLVAITCTALLSAILARRTGVRPVRAATLAGLSVLAAFILVYLEPTGFLFRLRTAIIGASSTPRILGFDGILALLGLVALAIGLRRMGAAA